MMSLSFSEIPEQLPVKQKSQYLCFDLLQCYFSLEVAYPEIHGCTVMTMGHLSQIQPGLY